MHGWSKATRICVMMALDTVFLIIELGVGYYVSSLALIADAFHMVHRPVPHPQRLTPAWFSPLSCCRLLT